jgi:3'-phosphoadenosine 5'-phosphosulfate sulfotransferase (PAPS reductase)/FAD synthetase
MILDTTTYEKHLEKSGALEAWMKLEKEHPDLKKYEEKRLQAEVVEDFKTVEKLRAFQNIIHEAAVKLSMAIYGAISVSLPKETVMVIGNSTGKDSTAVMALHAQWIKKQRRDGLNTPKTIVTIADTRAEFPLMAARMQTEKDDINKWAKKHDFPLTCHIEEPAVKGRLLVELLGNGKPLPALGSSTGSLGPSNWCMSRVKAQPIDAILKMIQGQGSQFLHGLGTRYAESAKRASTMERHNEGLPFSLGHMKMTKGAEKKNISNAMCFQPIAHWPDWMPFRFLENTIIPWNPTSVEQLKEAYDIAAGGGNISECGLRKTEDGSLTSVCQGLDGSGARMGCWMCFKVKNKSLINMAKADDRFVPLKKFHDHIMQIHKNDKARRERLSAAGFNSDTLCPKTFLFRERYYMLMLLFKAVEESGFDDLINNEELEQIQRFWRKHGIFSITTEMAKKDAAKWMQTGKMEISWEKKSEWINDLGGRLCEGLNLTAYWHILNPEYRALEWQRLLCMQDIPTNLIPRLQTYVFRDWDSDQYTFMVADCYGPVVTRSNKWIIDDLIQPNWELIKIREPSIFEKSITNGKSIFYTVDARKTCYEAEELRLKAEKGETLTQAEADKIDIALSILDTLDYEHDIEVTIQDEQALKPFIIKSHFKSLTPKKVAKLQNIIQGLSPIIEELNNEFSKKSEQLKTEFTARLEDEEALKKYRKRASQIFGVDKKHKEHLDLFDSQINLQMIETYIKSFSELGAFIIEEQIHPVVIEKLMDHESLKESNSLTLQSLSTEFKGEEPDYQKILPEICY